MRIPDWLVYAAVLVVVVTVLFVRDDSAPAPVLTPSAPLVTSEPALAESERRLLPAANPFDEKILVQVGDPEDGIGTAFAINPSGVWITARHVVDGCVEVGLSIGNGRVVPVTNVVRSEMSDLAVLYTDRAPKTVRMDLSRQLHVGDPGYHIGFPQGKTGEVASNLLARSSLVTRGRYSLEESVLAWVETARSTGLIGTLAGMSGGPVLDENGDVIGVTIAESPRRGRIYTTSPDSLVRVMNVASATAANTSEASRPLAVASFSDEANRMRREKSVVKVICRAGRL